MRMMGLRLGVRFFVLLLATCVLGVSGAPAQTQYRVLTEDDMLAPEVVAKAPPDLAVTLLHEGLVTRSTSYTQAVAWRHIKTMFPSDEGLIISTDAPNATQIWIHAASGVPNVQEELRVAPADLRLLCNAIAQATGMVLDPAGTLIEAGSKEPLPPTESRSFKLVETLAASDLQLPAAIARGEDQLGLQILPQGMVVRSCIMVQSFAWSDLIEMSLVQQQLIVHFKGGTVMLMAEGSGDETSGLVQNVKRDDMPAIEQMILAAGGLQAVPAEAGVQLWERKRAAQAPTTPRRFDLVH
jgi:hypothetical protein